MALQEATVNKQIYSISVILKFYGEKSDLENSSKNFPRREITEKISATNEAAPVIYVPSTLQLNSTQ